MENEAKFHDILDMIEDAIQSQSGRLSDGEEFNDETESILSDIQEHLAEILGLPKNYPA